MTMAEPGQRRKLAALMSADVAGYSRLMQDDEEATVETLTRYRSIFSSLVSRHEGRIVDSPGDNILAEFASPVEAVQCAVEVQRELARRNLQLADHRKMHFRIGINLGDILSRDDGSIYGDGVNVAARLESLAEPGGIMISESVCVQVRTLIDVGIAGAGEYEVKNIKQPVRVYRIVQAGTPSTRQGSRKSSRALIVVAAVVAFTIAVVAAVIFRLDDAPGDPVLAMPTGPTIAVLPFKNMSGHPEQEYFSDGMTEQLISELTRFNDFHVLAGSSTFQYKGKSVDVREIGRDLGAIYVVEGSVRRGENDVRVTVQLLNAKNGSHIWAESYNRKLTGADLLDIQDQITQQVVAKIADQYGVISMSRLQQKRKDENTDFDAYECELRVIEFYNAISPEKHLEVRTCIEDALQRFPDNVDLLAWQMLLTLDEHRMGLNPRPKPLERALEIGHRAVSLDRDNTRAQQFLAEVLFTARKLDEFLVVSERAVAMNPNRPSTMVGMGLFNILAGRLERGIALTNKGFALNPRGPGWYYFAPQNYYYAKGEYEKALDAAVEMKMPGFWWYHWWLAADYAQLGRIEEAQDEIQKLLDAHPQFGVDPRGEMARLLWNYDDLLEQYVDGLRKAGLNVPDEPDAAN
ncbi:MAG: hypothetical protein JSU95_03915 [Betaproteobacteria bacterium]|nr:MAG: hypothetical protein JSU95_03915 [Betaproteobacteria bacterium]